MARLGGLFHSLRTVLKLFKKKPLFRKELASFRRRLQTSVKNSVAQNWHKAAEKQWRENRFRSLAKPGAIVDVTTCNFDCRTRPSADLKNFPISSRQSSA
jgi:hypothetical protein